MGLHLHGPKSSNGEPKQSNPAEQNSNLNIEAMSQISHQAEGREGVVRGRCKTTPYGREPCHTKTSAWGPSELFSHSLTALVNFIVASASLPKPGHILSGIAVQQCKASGLEEGRNCSTPQLAKKAWPSAAVLCVPSAYAATAEAFVDLALSVLLLLSRLSRGTCELEVGKTPCNSKWLQEAPEATADGPPALSPKRLRATSRAASVLPACACAQRAASGALETALPVSTCEASKTSWRFRAGCRLSQAMHEIPAVLAHAATSNRIWLVEGSASCHL